MKVCFELPTMEQVDFEIEAREEYIEVRGNAAYTGNPKKNREIEGKIIQELENGNIWAWCTVKVTALWKGIKGVDYLGCCSYQSEEDFKKCGYFDDMKEIAYNNLIEYLEDLKD